LIIKKYACEEIPVWRDFITQYGLTIEQQKQFAQYLTVLIEQNELFNLTAITEPADIIAYHFQDSLAISKVIDFKHIESIADVGSGAGFPGIPLKILFPHLKLVLIEVASKKVTFLTDLISMLNLEQSSVCDFDWRTFLRKTQQPIDMFVSRASLHVDELLRMFKPSCPYHNQRLVYWASKEWQISPEEKQFFEKEESYMIQHKKRRLIFFARHS
jgi:16S rRNA (guanine527-N7)-methyltransferase